MELFNLKNAKNEEEKKLASWVGRQRQAYKNNKLDKEKVVKLNEINFI